MQPAALIKPCISSYAIFAAAAAQPRFALPSNLPLAAACLPDLQLARSLGVEQFAVVVTKLDTCDFSPDRFQAIKWVAAAPSGAAWCRAELC